jgi:pilus assembly protein CpaC
VKARRYIDTSNHGPTGLRLALIAILGFTFGWSPRLAAQDDPEPTEKSVRNVNLLVGIYQDEAAPRIVGEISTSGTFREFTGVQYLPDRKILRFNPRKEGLGTLTIKSKATGETIYTFTVTVRRTELARVAREIRDLLADVEGIQIRIINNKVLVDGQILLPRDMKRIHTVVKQYGEQAVSLVTLSPGAQRKIAELIQRDINNPEVRVRAVNNKFILEGFVDSADDKAQAEIIAKAYVPDVVVDQAVADKKVLERQSDVVINLIEVRPPAPEGPKKLVQMSIHYVELSKDYTKGFRFQWTPEIADGTEVSFGTGSREPGGVTSTITGTISNFLPKLNWAKSHGHARVLQSTSMIVEDGSEGMLNSTERIPYQSATSTGQLATNFQDTGLKAAITPQILGARSDSVKLKIGFNVSELVGMEAAGPLISSRQVQTTIVVRSGQSAAVGGLVNTRSGTDYNKLPPGVSNPLLSLYTSKSFRKNQSQFVVFVTPVIKSSASQGVNKIKRKFQLRE